MNPSSIHIILIILTLSPCAQQPRRSWSWSRSLPRCSFKLRIRSHTRTRTRTVKRLSSTNHVFHRGQLGCQPLYPRHFCRLHWSHLANIILIIILSLSLSPCAQQPRRSWSLLLCSFKLRIRSHRHRRTRTVKRLGSTKDVFHHFSRGQLGCKPLYP